MTIFDRQEIIVTLKPSDESLYTTYTTELRTVHNDIPY